MEFQKRGEAFKTQAEFLYERRARLEWHGEQPDPRKLEVLKARAEAAHKEYKQAEAQREALEKAFKEGHPRNCPPNCPSGGSKSGGGMTSINNVLGQLRSR